MNQKNPAKLKIIYGEKEKIPNPAANRKDLPKPPKHLSKEAKRKWGEFVAAWDFNLDALLILRTALEAFDRMNQAREILAREGITILDHNGVIKSHPCVGIERDSRSAMNRAFKQLGLDRPVRHNEELGKEQDELEALINGNDVPRMAGKPPKLGRPPKYN